MDVIANIPADTLVQMTMDFHRLFNEGGCDPACHGCNKKIPVGDKFKLATVLARTRKKFEDGSGHFESVIKSKEVMLCPECKPEDVSRKAEENTEGSFFSGRRGGYGCYRVNGKIATDQNS